MQSKMTAAAVSFLVIFTATNAGAYICGEQVSIRKERRWAQAIFTGEVVEVSTPCSGTSRCGCYASSGNGGYERH